ncbi:MAG: 2-hydroxyacyl-CoA dehydratase [Clostridia bacterium]|nr:2-hydroxyacyl-CoA dehydratase [Clostridia bacterium]
MKRIGIDIGSTTVKCIVLAEDGRMIFSLYERHRSRASEKMAQMLDSVTEKFPGEQMQIGLSGSAGMGMAQDMDLPFIQEVYATRLSTRELLPDTDTVVELGGEDAKILFLSDTMEVRMNGSCAGGTGAFIDQMAELMSVTPEEMETLAEHADRSRIYTIASRCGVFAKSDIQPLLNQGARKEDVAASIFYAVVNQTIAGLAQGREICGKVLYLGGPLTFFPALRNAFDDVLHIKGICPENSLYFVARGAAISPGTKAVDPADLAARARSYQSTHTYPGCRPLFCSKEEYEAFSKRHEKDSGSIKEISEPNGPMYLGIDAGSTTVKAVLCDENGDLFHPLYLPNSGNPVPLIREYLSDLYRRWPEIEIAGCAVTGYGESIIKNAFCADIGIVETIAHYTAAKRFCPDVDFILDIGGQDIKCFKIRGGVIDSIFLNEACSSGCGSFLQTFAGVLGFSAEEFSKKALLADAPVDLGSRCTVFMNSSVKQAQKDGASLENIAAGLALSVVKNALYKVIRIANPSTLGEHIVVQGGTFYNDAVLRAFEQETGREVLRPRVAGLMGAYGAALYAKDHMEGRPSSIINAEGLAHFSHEVKTVVCNGCSNHCHLTVNTFGKGPDARRYIAGNRCEKPLGTDRQSVHLDMFAYKYGLLSKYRQEQADDGRPVIGIPMGLNMYELLPFWHRLFTELGYRVVVSGESSHALYVRGQHTIPSDTACYPAKLLHGHMEDLYSRGVRTVFYPCMSYNLDEKKGQNHYNCPVVAYYPTVLEANVRHPEGAKFIRGFIGLHDRDEFTPHFVRMMGKYGITLDENAVRKAAAAAYAELDGYLKNVRDKAAEYMTLAKEKGMPVIVLAGRPYHLDPEINHGIHNLVCDMGAAVLTEDSVAWLENAFKTTVLNQWTYHARLYSAARYVAGKKDLNMHLVQLVSFGCGVDAVTTDETRVILEHAGKPYTQIKIDEITNLGAVKIRLRSLFAVIGESDTGRKE